MSPVCIASPPLFGKVRRCSVLLLLIYARAGAHTVAAAVEFIVTSFNGQKAVSRIPVHWNLYGSLCKWDVTRLTGQ